MTVQAETPLSSFTYAGGGLTLSFAWSFDRESELLVTLNGAALGYLTDYTVDGGGDPLGGSITLLATPALTDVIVVRRTTELERQTDYVSALTTAQLNRDFDRLWWALQEAVYLGVATSIRIDGDELGDVTGLILPDAAGRALRTLTFDADGNILLLLTSTLLNDSFNSLPFITSLVGDADSFVVYDDSADAGARIIVDNAIGKPLGQGRWRLGAGIVLSAGVAKTVVYNLTTVDALRRGAYNPATGEYTCSIPCTLQVSASISLSVMGEGEFLQLDIEHQGASFARDKMYNETTDGGLDYIVAPPASLYPMAAGEVVRVRVLCSGSRTTDALNATCHLSIIELS